MKKITLLLLLIFIISCTSNTIFKAPEDLIPKDSMQLLINDMLLASSAKYPKNKNLEKNINYMPLVYEKYHIDSTRFQRSIIYYTSKIDEFNKMLDTIKARLELSKKVLVDQKREIDSLRRDSIRQLKTIDKVLTKNE